MTTTETTALVTMWQPAAQAIVDQLTDFFGARLRLGEVTVDVGPRTQLLSRLPASTMVVQVQLEGAPNGVLTVAWAVSDTTGAASWAEAEEVRQGLWEAITIGISTGLGGQVTVHAIGEPQPGVVPAEEVLLAWEASGDGVTVSLGFVVPQEAVPESVADVAADEGPTKVPTRPPQLGVMRPEPRQGAVRDLDLILDLPLRLTVEIGSKRLLIKDVLALGKGSVVELNRLAGDPVDVLINGKQLAKGEIVVLPDGNFGVRMVEISGSQDRLRSLQDE